MSPMRVFGISAAILLSVINLCWSQVDVGSSQSASLPMYRPVLLGSGPDSLINRIDSTDLVRKGQKDAAVMFSCSVKKDGTVLSVSAYRGTRGWKWLEQEILKKWAAAANPKFIRAINNRMPREECYVGWLKSHTVMHEPVVRSLS